MKTKSILLAALLCSAGYQSALAVQVFSWEDLRRWQVVTIFWDNGDEGQDEYLIQNADTGIHVIPVTEPSIAGFFAAVTDGVDNRVGMQQAGPPAVGGIESDESTVFDRPKGMDLQGVAIDYFQLDVGPVFVTFSGHTYDAPVPDGGATIALLGLGLVGVLGVRHLTAA